MIRSKKCTGPANRLTFFRLDISLACRTHSASHSGPNGSRVRNFLLRKARVESHWSIGQGGSTRVTGGNHFCKNSVSEPVWWLVGLLKSGRILAHGTCKIVLSTNGKQQNLLHVYPILSTLNLNLNFLFWWFVREVTPDLIPNSEVKLSRGDDTWISRESSSSPEQRI